MASKDFAAIESDYAFFVSHSTEAESDAAQYARELDGFAERRELIRMFDFGCGTGEFSQRLLAAMNWPASRLAVTLVELVLAQRESAARRLARFSERPIATFEALPAAGSQVDLILANHSLYYVDDLHATLRQFVESLSPGGLLVAAIAGWDNALMQLWKIGFGLLEQPVPYYAADDVEEILSRLGIEFRKAKSQYRLRFADSPENRLKILRFLFGEYFARLPRERMLGEFDCHANGGHVDVSTHSYHFAVKI